MAENAENTEKVVETTDDISENAENAENVTETTDDQEEKEPLNCTVTVEESGAWKKKISVQIPREEIDKELNSQYGELKKSAEVPGFRKGHAPRKLVEKRFGEDVSNQTKLKLLAQAFEKIDGDYDFKVLGEPDFDPEKIELPETDDLNFEYEIEVKPEFELPELENIKIEKQIIEITDERVNDAIDELLRRRGHLDDAEKAEENDLVWADITMKVEGEEATEHLKDKMIRCDSTALMGVMIEDMAEVLSGAKIGDTCNCTAEVPDTHEKEEYRGKKAEFTIAVKNVRRLMPAELNEEMLNSFGMDSEEDLRRNIQDNLENQVDQESRRQMVQQVYKYLGEKIEFELPTGVAARYTDRVLMRQYYDLTRQGVPEEKIQENMEKLRAASSTQAASELKMSFIMERVADKLEIEVGEAKLNGHIAQMAAQQRRRPERLRDELQREGRLELLESEIREEEAVDRILEMAEVVDAPVEKKKKATKVKKDTKEKKVKKKKKEEKK